MSDRKHEDIWRHKAGGIDETILAEAHSRILPPLSGGQPAPGAGTLPTDPAARKNIPLFRGVFKYFPDALCEVAELSRIGNEQHNPGQEMHWAKGKSTDHGDCILRHQIDVGTLDIDGVRHATKVAWRALAQLQIELDNGRKPVILVGQSCGKTTTVPVMFTDGEDRQGS